MPKRDDALLIDDMILCFKSIAEYTKDMSFENFLNSKMCVDAVIRNFEVIGEAANILSKDFKDRHQQIEWRIMTDFRNRLIHDYFGISYKVVWSIIINEVPDYISKLETFI